MTGKYCNLVSLYITVISEDKKIKNKKTTFTFHCRLVHRLPQAQPS